MSPAGTELWKQELSLSFVQMCSVGLKDHSEEP